MKKSICLFLLLLAATFQVTFAQEEDPFSPTTNPCGGTTRKMEVHNTIIPEGCPGCRLLYVGVYSVVDQMPTFEISQILVSDECKKCFSIQKLYQIALSNFITQLVEGKWGEFKDFDVAIAFAKSCVKATYEKFPKEKLDKKFDGGAVTPDPDPNPLPTIMPINQISSSDSVSLWWIRPCNPNLTYCCKAMLHIETVDDDDGTRSVVYIKTIQKFPTESFCGKISTECEYNCDALDLYYMNPTFLPDSSTQNIIVSPNPTSGNVTILIDGFDTGDYSFDVNDTYGNTIHSSNLTISDESRTANIAITIGQTGTYVYAVKQNGIILKSGLITVVR